MPIIFIPGIKGSELVDTYPTDFPVRWSLEDMVLGNLIEDESDLLLRDGKFDTDLHLFREWRPIRYAYSRLITRLRKHDPHCYLFTYDWRRQIEFSAQKLADFIQTISTKHNHDTQPEISFVTHSMGGLVLRSAFSILPNVPLHRIVFIAPPFRGAADICKVLIAGERNGWFSDTESYRKLARSFPSIYQLIPSFEDALVRSLDGHQLNPYDINNWQNNVTVDGTGFHDTLLTGAEAFVRGENAGHGGSSPAPMLDEEQLVKQYGEQTLILLGTGQKTTWQIPVDTLNSSNPNWFGFDNARHDLLGDGRVHMKSSAIRGISLAAFDTGNSHGEICRHEMIQKATVMWLKKGRVLKFKPRTRRNSVRRPSKTNFGQWDGNEASFRSHRI